MFDIVTELVTELVQQCWLVLGQMAPYLLFGFLMAGVLSVCVSPAWVQRHLGKRGLGPVLAASAFGVPLPLCSCSVIPVSASIRRHGASRAATTAFLLSTPQTGVDSIAVTYALLGPVFAVVRPVVALLTGVLGGCLVLLLGETTGARQPDPSRPAGCSEACCADASSTDGHPRGAVRRVLTYGFVTLPRDIGAALLVGVLIAGAMATLVPEGQLHTYVGGGILSILLLIVVGVPFYVCATASVPIVVGFIHMGASPGAALAFLIAGPATNAAALTTIWRVLGRRTAILYLISVTASAIGSGLLMDWLIPTAGSVLPALEAHVHSGAEGSWPSDGSAALLLAVVAFSYVFHARGHAGPAGTQPPTIEDTSAAQRLEMRITGLRCSHCVQTVRDALAECRGVLSAEVTLKRGHALVVGNDLDVRQLIAAVVELGYKAEVRADVQPAGQDRSTQSGGA